METLHLSMIGLYKLKKKILFWTLSLMGKDKQNIHSIQLECDRIEDSCGGNYKRVLEEKILFKNTPESSCISELKYHLFTNILFKNVVGFQSRETISHLFVFPSFVTFLTFYIQRQLIIIVFHRQIEYI